jgi:integrase
MEQKKETQPMTNKPKVIQRRFRFSAEKLAALPVPSDKPLIVYDSDVKGLCYRIQPSGSSVFFVLKKVCGRTYRKTLGNGDLKLPAARECALDLLARVAKWLAGDRKDICPMLRPLDDSLTFRDAFEMYLKAPRKRVPNDPIHKAKAEKRSRYLCTRYLASVAERSIDELTPTVVGKLHEKLTEDFGAIAANRAHELLRAVYNHLIEKGLWTTVNPSKGATRAPKTERAIILQDEQLKPFFDALDAEKNRDLAEFLGLLLSTGARKSNLYAAEWREISLPMKTWTVPAEKSKNGKITTLTLKREAVALFKARKQRQMKEGQSPWVFPTKAGSKSKHVEDFKNQFTRVKKAAGLTNFTFHDLRRSFIAFLVQSGVPIPIASEAAGHSSPVSMTPYLRFAKGAVAKGLEQGELDMQRRMNEAEAEKKEQEQKQLSA